jgi:two-component system nitrogen regulation response regulator GlnG
MNRILIIDDEPAIGWSLRELLTDEGHAVEVASSAEAALETCGRFAPEAMLVDVRLPGRDGLTALPDLRAAAPGAAIVVMTAFGDLDTAVRAVAAGAFDYLVKPFDLASVSQVVSRALADRGQPAPTAGADSAPAKLVGSSPAMQGVFKQIAVAAATDLPVLITGETGTGKELAARAIHAHSRRRDRPLIATSLAALAPSVVESELFGHVRGAFTGATADRRGLFEQADGGTLLLDEIGDAPPEVQAKLLRVLEDRTITPVGSSSARPVDVRVIAATNRDLVAALEAGQFRPDLYHRLRVLELEMPPLAARPDDLPALVAHFLAAAGHGGRQASAAFLAAVRGRRWPGNVRELRHAVESAAAMARGGSLAAEHLPAELPTQSRGAAPSLDADELVVAAVRQWVDAAWDASTDAGDLHARLVQVVEKTLAEQAVDRAGGNRTAAAKILGLDRATLRSKLQG